MIIGTYQYRVTNWCLRTFGGTTASDVRERCYRFLEEALELVQSLGMSREEAHKLVDYVFNRDKGETAQEIGGVMVTLSALVSAHGLDLEDCAIDEIERIEKPAMVEKIRRKHASKPLASPLPEDYPKFKTDGSPTKDVVFEIGAPLAHSDNWVGADAPPSPQEKGEGV